MKTNSSHSRWSSWRLLAVSLAGAALLAGCGMGTLDGTSGASSAGVGTGGTGSFKASLSGSASEGYLINAVVFLDKNANYQLDSGEPFAATDMSGSCTLAVNPADVGAYPIVALAVKGVTIDSVGMQPITSSYVLSLPREGVNGGVNLISPLSTQLRELMETGRYSTAQQALDALTLQMGLPAGTNILDAATASENLVIRTTSKTIADLMSKQMDGMLNQEQALDVERYRTMMALIESNLKIVAQLNTPQNLANLSNSMTVILSARPAATTSQTTVTKAVAQGADTVSE